MDSNIFKLQSVSGNDSLTAGGSLRSVGELLPSWRPAQPMIKIINRVVLSVLAGAIVLGSALAAEPVTAPQESASVLFNRGNAFAGQGQPGLAVLAFERAQQLAPRDPAIAARLQTLRDTAGLPSPALPWWQSAARQLSMNELACSGSLALALVCGAISLSRLLPKGFQRPLKALTALCAIAVLISATGLWLRWPELSRAVVVSSHVTALIAPAESAGSNFTLIEGDIVAPKKVLRNFILVRTLDGRSGWVSRAQIERVIPAPAPDRAG